MRDDGILWIIVEVLLIIALLMFILDDQHCTFC